MNFRKNDSFLWFNLIKPFALTFLAIQLLTRIGLLIYSGQAGDLSLIGGAGMFGWGFLFDIQVLGLFLLPLLVIHLLVSRRHWLGNPLRIMRLVLFAILTYIWLFSAVSEYFFWEEFATRFNFIAVDYLVYTTEVIGNIKESYPLYPLLTAIAVTTGLTTFACRKLLWLNDRAQTETSRACGLILAALPLLMLPILNLDQVRLSSNQAIQELATNGIYDLFSAYRHNELSYKKFYMTGDEKKIDGNIRRLIADNTQFVNQDPDNITRTIKKNGAELHKNVVLVVMESMSADFMGVFGNQDGLTPEMDALRKKSLFFTDFYATGTRTVRGLEAVTLSIPPTPGQSILRRPGNENLFSLGYVFQDRNYDTAFIYGGHGYFDNMNAFFSQNGFRIVDRNDFAKGDVTFSNVWGVADEDLYNQVIKQADNAYGKKQPFMYEVMTTSNHRPYTYPDGRIDLPSKIGGRAGGVKYADYAVGKFLKDAAKKPWFKDTVFIFVADHTAGAGGKIDLSPVKYHIPAIFYSPGFIKPRKYEETASQIDIGPTLLGLLNFSYYTKFFGHDLSGAPKESRALISNYQKVAYMKNGQLTVLKPKKEIEFFAGEKSLPAAQADQNLLNDAITYYQYASEWKKRMGRIPSVYKH